MGARVEVRHHLPAVMCLLLAACTAASGGPSTTDPAPTATLRPAVAFVSGQEDVPQGQYLVVEWFTWNSGVTTDPALMCPYAAMIDFPGYSLVDGRLSFPGTIDDDGSLVGFAAQGQANGGAMGGGVSSGLTPILDLPFAYPYGEPILYAAYADGSIVVDVGGGFYQLAPGESWVSREEWDPSPTCHASRETRLTNYGLLSRAAIFGLE